MNELPGLVALGAAWTIGGIHLEWGHYGPSNCMQGLNLTDTHDGYACGLLGMIKTMIQDV